MKSQFKFDLEQHLKEDLLKFAKENHTTMSDIMRAAITKYIYILKTKKDVERKSRFSYPEFVD